ncbi:unnamed protein product, partial [Timema podura]|nr:unnamed protein product [Timema podura]
MPVPLFPSLNPKLTDSLWFNVDKAIDEEAELTLIEQEHTTWLNNVTNEDYELIPIGKTASEFVLRVTDWKGCTCVCPSCDRLEEVYMCLSFVWQTGRGVHVFVLRVTDWKKCTCVCPSCDRLEEVYMCLSFVRCKCVCPSCDGLEEVLTFKDVT